MVLDKIKALLTRSKSVAKVTEEKPHDVVQAKPLEAVGEKPDRTTSPQRVPKASRKKAGKRKRAG